MLDYLQNMRSKVRFGEVTDEAVGGWSRALVKLVRFGSSSRYCYHHFLLHTTCNYTPLLSKFYATIPQNYN